MFIGMGMPIPDLANLPGPSRPGGGGGTPFEYTAIDNSFSMEFDGVSSYFDPGTDSSLDIFGSDFSASLWFNNPVSGTNTSAGLIQIASFTTKFAITKGSNAGNLGFVIGTNSWRYNIGSGLNDGNWHHVALVRDSGTYTFYIDKTAYTSFSSGTYNTGGYNSIGRGLQSFQYFTGHLDEIALFNHAISANTVDAIYDATANNPGKVADLSETPGGAPIAWYRMGD